MDRHGARPVLVVSLAFMGVSFLIRPAMTELWHWYGLSFLQFIGISGITALPAGRLIAIWFPASQGRIMGVTVAGINVGGITIPFIVNLTLGASGWQAAYVAMGIIAVSLAALALLFVREHPPELQDGSSGQFQEADRRMSGLPLSAATRTRSFYAIVGALAPRKLRPRRCLPPANPSLHGAGSAVNMGSHHGDGDGRRRPHLQGRRSGISRSG